MEHQDNNGVIPYELKLARVIPIFKSGNVTILQL